MQCLIFTTLLFLNNIYEHEIINEPANSLAESIHLA